jgi:hypothetical protein
VRNYVACIKVAEDFVSPENIKCCVRLTEVQHNAVQRSAGPGQEGHMHS